MSVEGVILGFLINALVTFGIGVAAAWWFWKRQEAADGERRVSYALLQEQILTCAPSLHVHDYALPGHEHTHDHPHNHEHLQHTHTLETMSKHEENGRSVFVKYCGVCHTVFRDIAEPAAV